MKVAVLGHSVLNIAPAVAADLALRGLDVAWWPAPATLRARGWIEVVGGQHLDAGRSGPARMRMPDTSAEALAGAEAVIVDIPTDELIERLRSLAAEVPDNALLHVQSHGYWPAARLAQNTFARRWVLADSSAPTHAAAFGEGVLQVHVRRRGLRFACLQGDALPRLELLYPGAELARSPLETGLEGINLLVHPGATVANLGALEQAAAAGRGFGFYAEGNNAAAARLAGALDEERGAVCRAWGLEHRRLPQLLGALYGARGTTVREAIAGCAFYAALGPLPAIAPASWARTDLPFALVPLVRLAAARGVEVPLHRGVVAVLGTAFGIDPWTSALELADIGALP